MFIGLNRGRGMYTHSVLGCGFIYDHYLSSSHLSNFVLVSFSYCDKYCIKIKQLIWERIYMAYNSMSQSITGRSQGMNSNRNSKAENIEGCCLLHRFLLSLLLYTAQDVLHRKSHYPQTSRTILQTCSQLTR